MENKKSLKELLKVYLEMAETFESQCGSAGDYIGEEYYKGQVDAYNKALTITEIYE